MKQLLLLTVLITSVLCGCETPPSRIAFNSVASVVAGVDAAMKTWAVYVKKQRQKLEGNEAGLAALAHNEEKVRITYDTYRTAARAAIGSAALVAGTVNSNAVAPPELVSQAAALQSLVLNLSK